MIAVFGLFVFSEQLMAQADHGDLQSIYPGEQSEFFTSKDSRVIPNWLIQTPLTNLKQVRSSRFYHETDGTVMQKALEVESVDKGNLGFQESINGLQLDYSLKFSYGHRLLRSTFLQEADIFLSGETEDQFLYSIDINPSLIIFDRIALNFIYSYLPEQENFSGSGVLDFEVQQTIVDNVNRFSGRALSVSGSYSLPINDWIWFSMELGFTHMRLNTEEVVRYHPSDPFLPSFRIVRLTMNKKRADYTHPFIGVGGEFKLQKVRLGLGYQHQVYQLDQASSSGFTVSMGVRFSDLF